MKKEFLDECKERVFEALLEVQGEKYDSPEELTETIEDRVVGDVIYYTEGTEALEKYRSELADYWNEEGYIFIEQKDFNPFDDNGMLAIWRGMLGDTTRFIMINLTERLEEGEVTLSEARVMQLSRYLDSFRTYPFSEEEYFGKYPYIPEDRSFYLEAQERLLGIPAPVIKMSEIEGLMQEPYQLVYMEPQDNLNDSLELMQYCLEQKSPALLWERADEWWYDESRDPLDAIIDDLKKQCETKLGYSTEEVERAFEVYQDDDLIEEAILERCEEEDTTRYLLKQTAWDGAVPIRVEVNSPNKELLSPEFHLSHGYSYEKSYFGDMVDLLQLNPAKVKEMLEEKGIEAIGTYPDLPERNGNEVVTYNAFMQELQENVGTGNQLTFLATLKLTDALDAGFDLKDITIPKGNQVGLYSSVDGAGGQLGMELQRDLALPLGGAYSPTITIDGEGVYRGYSIQETYGFAHPERMFGKPVAVNTQAQAQSLHQDVSQSQGNIVKEAEQTLGKGWKEGTRRQEAEERSQDQGKSMKL